MTSSKDYWLGYEEALKDARVELAEMYRRNAIVTAAMIDNMLKKLIDQ